MSDRMEKEIVVGDDAYYKEARSWYSFVYLSLISERFFYIILTIIALITFLLSSFAFLSLLPITETVPFLYQSENVQETVPRLVRLRAANTDDVNGAIREFFVKEYVKHRENYSRRTIVENDKFILNHSNKAAAIAYRRYIGQKNSRSPLVLYGARGRRSVVVNEIHISSVNGESGKYRADVEFTANVIWEDDSKSSKWSGIILFDYKPLKVVGKTKDEIDTGNLASDFDVTPMKFKVTNYESRSY